MKDEATNATPAAEAGSSIQAASGGVPSVQAQATSSPPASGASKMTQDTSNADVNYSQTKLSEHEELKAHFRKIKLLPKANLEEFHLVFENMQAAMTLHVYMTQQPGMSDISMGELYAHYRAAFDAELGHSGIAPMDADRFPVIIDMLSNGLEIPKTYLRLKPSQN